ncbi:septum formation family protein [Mycolicibacterium hodleri]|uniref:Septum formation-related domain-containing protein n=1 Tax=Mycolicibacterium hodleri TaxID=49897 RepID=A0A502DVT9_9MYCO|nr:septum formation family protein [Mycolicibacterium hodleri]TPG29615.1 hypothetical protein EAH80_26760 [Mycolicibacterium hodleri]
MRNPQAGKCAPDLASVLAALEDECSGPDREAKRRRARAHRRGILTLAMIALLVGGVIQLFTATPETRSAADVGSRASVVFSNAGTGTCLSWPPDAPEKPSFVQCRSDHMFEVAKPVGMTSFGEPCQLAVREYLGTRYDPNSRFTISVLWAGDAKDGNTDARNLLCGLQLLGPGGKPVLFKGRIVDLDQSKVWPAGTCLGIDSSNRSTDIPVDCSTPHGLEVSGAVSLAERFPGSAPSDADQRPYITDACTRMADAYLAPARLAKSGLTLAYETLSPASWAAGSRQVSCSIGRPAKQGWAPTTGSARTLSPADLPPPAAPPPSTSQAPPPLPPPVYQEPLIPVGPLPTEVPPPVPPSPSTEAPPITEPSPPSAPSPLEPSPAVVPTPTPEPLPPQGPLPGPATPPSEAGPEPTPGVLEIPGVPPVTPPAYVPPAA